MITQVDKLGRIVLRKKLRDKYGKQFIIIEKEKELVLKPLHLDMSDLAEKIKKYSLRELKKMAEEEGKKQAAEALK